MESPLIQSAYFGKREGMMKNGDANQKTAVTVFHQERLDGITGNLWCQIMPKAWLVSENKLTLLRVNRLKGKGREKKKWQMYRKPNQRMVTQQPEVSILETTSQTTTENKAKAEVRR